MNVREEDRQKNNCPSRGLGLAAAAIGVGVGAALFYFFSKRPENPDAGGSTSEWSCEQPHSFSPLHNHEDSYITISENSTTDTSMFTSDDPNSQIYDTSSEVSSDEESDSSFCDCSSNASNSGSDSDESLVNLTNYTSESDNQSSYSFGDTSEVGPNLSNNIESEPDMEWDITESSAGVPEFGTPSHIPSRFRLMINHIEANFIPKHRILTAEEMRRNVLRDQAFRERSWSLEECSICFDVILKDQQVTTLPCTHNFHAECIAPWLQEQQTCPNCRKAAE